MSAPFLNASRRMPSSFFSKTHSGPLNRSRVSVAAMGSIHSGNASPTGASVIEGRRVGEGQAPAVGQRGCQGVEGERRGAGEEGQAVRHARRSVVRVVERRAATPPRGLNVDRDQAAARGAVKDERSGRL